MKKLLTVLLVLSLNACATARTRTSDPVMRIAIDSDSIPAGSYARLEKALVESGKFIVVDRSAGFRAITKEQELQHTTTRFGSAEKYALWGKMYGVGGIFVGVQQCQAKQRIFLHGDYLDCTLNLSLINATTGEVMAVSEKNADADNEVAPEWTESVDALIDNYPKVFVSHEDLNRTVNYDASLAQYREKTVIENKKSDLTLRPEDMIKR